MAVFGKSRPILLPCVMAGAVSVLLLNLPLAFVAQRAGMEWSQLMRPARSAGGISSSSSSSLHALGLDSATEVKTRLMDLLNDPEVKKEVMLPEGKPTRGRIDELIMELERKTPTEEPVYSDSINGDWTVKYSGTYAPGLLSSPTRELALFLYGGGFSLGGALASFASGFWGQTLGIKVEDLEVTITGGRDVSASATVQFAGQTEYLKYTAELLPLSASRMSEEVLSLKMPQPLGEQDLPLELRRTILVTYLDDEVMVVRDESGLADVLVRPVAPTPAPEAPVAPAVEAPPAEPMEPPATAPVESTDDTATKPPESEA